MGEPRDPHAGEVEEAGCIFHSLPASKGDIFKDPFVASNLERWGLTSTLRVARFRYDRGYHKMAADEMLLDMFNDIGFRNEFKVRSAVPEVPSRPARK